MALNALSAAVWFVGLAIYKASVGTPDLAKHKEFLPTTGCAIGMVALFSFLPLDLRNQPLAKTGVAGQALVVIGDLFSEILLFHFQQSFGIFALHPRNEEPEEAANQV